MWNNDRPDLHDLGASVFQDWIREKYEVDFAIDSDELYEFEAHSRKDRKGAKRSIQIENRRAEDDRGGRATEFVLREDHRGEHWVTTLRFITSPEERWVWVDTEQVSDNPFARRPSVIAPRFVPKLIGRTSSLGRYPLHTKPRAFRLHEIPGAVDFLLDPSREVPVSVFSAEPIGDQWVKRAELAAKNLAGLTLTWLLPPDVVDSFTAAIGEDMGVWGGGVRTYLPVARPAAPDPTRHRYIPVGRLAGRELDLAASIIGTQLLGATSRRRAPRRYRETLGRLLKLRGDLLDLDLAEDLLSESEARREELEAVNDDLEQEAWALREDLELAQERANSLANRVAWLEDQRPLSPSERLQAETAGPPANASSLDEAVELTREHCSGVVLPDSAEFDLNEMELAFPDTTCANAIWTCMLALDAYAKANFDGDFRHWSRESNDPRALPVSQIAMRESESVRNSKKSRGERTLVIDEAVGVGSATFMEAHLKPLNGHSDLIPRIYFYDDVRGRTGKVHVGAIGPHRRFPNSKS